MSERFDIGRQIAENNEPKPFYEGLDDTIISPAEIPIREWIQTYVDNGTMTDLEAFKLLMDWRARFRDGDRYGD